MDQILPNFDHLPPLSGQNVYSLHTTRPGYIYSYGENKEWKSSDNLKIFEKAGSLGQQEQCPKLPQNHRNRKVDKISQLNVSKDVHKHRLRTPREEIAFTARPKWTFH